MERERINRESVSRTIQQKNNSCGAYMVDNRSDKNQNYLSDSPLQRISDEEEELLQGKFDAPLQRVEDEEDTLQGKFDSPIQKKNETGMPDNLKAGIESLSGFSMDDVRVHYNSSKPATVQALAYTQGTDIHVAPGQEKCLPHEAWHVAQQMAGRVSPTTNINGMPVNDNAALEHEADVMGEKAVSQRKETCALKKENNGFVAQRMGFRKILNAFGVNMSSIKEIEKVAEQNENQTRTYEYANILLEDANKRRHDSKMKLGELGENESLSDSEGIPENFTDAATASSVFDSSSQGESLQRKANITNGTVQRVVQRDLTSNRDVEKEDEIHFNEQIENIMDSNPNEFRKDNCMVQMNCIGNVRGFVTLHIGASVEYKDDVRAMFYQWVDDVKSKAILVPDGLDIFVSDKFDNQCSYNFNSGKICLKPSSINDMFDTGKNCAENNMMINSVPYACSGDNKVKFGSAVIMHELGHVLHEKTSFEFFNQKQTPLIDNRGNERVDTALKVSYYACKPQQSEAEFVAEVFAGLANGLCFDEDVVSLYWKLNGPRCAELIERDNGKYGFRNASECIFVLDNSAQGESLQRKADMANNAAQRAEAPRPNNTGMPDNLKAGIESLSGFSMDDVRVHYNSSKPATVQALAYTQGSDIHVAPGQEKHLPHEAWHVAQQMAGRVSSTTNINGMPVNDNAALEHEADVMGEKAVQCKMQSYRNESSVLTSDIGVIQCYNPSEGENGRKPFQPSPRKKSQSTSSQRVVKVGVSYRTDGNGITAIEYDWAAIDAANALFTEEDDIRIVAVPLPRKITLEKKDKEKNNWGGPSRIERTFDAGDLDDIDMIYIPGNPHALDEQIDLNAEEHRKLEADPIAFTSERTHHFDFDFETAILELETQINNLDDQIQMEESMLNQNAVYKQNELSINELDQQLGSLKNQIEQNNNSIKDNKDASERARLINENKRLSQRVKEMNSQKKQLIEKNKPLSKKKDELIEERAKKEEKLREMEKKRDSFQRRNDEYQNRSDYEQKLVTFARNHGIPVLGVCGGSWQLYRNFGGTTVLLNSEQYENHAKKMSDNDAHSVTAEPETMLAGIMGTNPISVNSTHWASISIDDFASGMRRLFGELIDCDRLIDISAFENGNSPEAFETRYGVPMMGIQWHPETFLPGMDGYDLMKDMFGDEQIRSSKEIFKFMLKTAIARQIKKETLKGISRRKPSRQQLFRRNNCLPVAILGRELSELEAIALRFALAAEHRGNVGDFLYDDLGVIQIIVRVLNIPDQIIVFRNQNGVVLSRYVIRSNSVTVYGPFENIDFDDLPIVVIRNIANYHFERVGLFEPYSFGKRKRSSSFSE